MRVPCSSGPGTKEYRAASVSATVQSRAMQDDRAAIEALHKRDEEASKRGDFDVLRTLMHDDAVVLAPGGLPIRGRAEIDTTFAKAGRAARSADVVEYHLDFEEVEIIGDRAIEWGAIRGVSKMPDGSLVESAYNVLRVLAKDANGEWKVYRTIWNAR